MRYIDLVSRTRITMKDVFKFMNLETNNALLRRCRLHTVHNFKKINNYTVSEGAKELMKQYGFQLEISFFNSMIIPPVLTFFGRIWLEFLRLIYGYKK